MTKILFIPYLHGLLLTVVDHHRGVRTSPFSEELMPARFLVLEYSRSLSLGGSVVNGIHNARGLNCSG